MNEDMERIPQSINNDTLVSWIGQQRSGAEVQIWIDYRLKKIIVQEKIVIYLLAWTFENCGFFGLFLVSSAKDGVI